MFKYFIVKDRTNKKNYLSLSTKVVLGEDILRMYLLNYAEKKQLNPDTLAIFAEDDQGNLTRFASYAEQNMPIKECSISSENNYLDQIKTFYEVETEIDIIKAQEEKINQLEEKINELRHMLRTNY